MTVVHPDGLPELFLDRSLGRRQVPALLRDVGLRLCTLAEVYGIPADETIADTEWLARAGQQGWVVLMKDDRIRYRPAAGTYEPPRWRNGSSTCSNKSPKPAINQGHSCTPSPKPVFAGYDSTAD